MKAQALILILLPIVFSCNRQTIEEKSWNGSYQGIIEETIVSGRFIADSLGNPLLVYDTTYQEIPAEVEVMVDQPDSTISVESEVEWLSFETEYFWLNEPCNFGDKCHFESLSTNPGFILHSRTIYLFDESDSVVVEFKYDNSLDIIERKVFKGEK